MTKAIIDRTATAQPTNPYAAPPSNDGCEIEPAIIQIRSVARVFKIVGWFGVIIYAPIVIVCVGSLLVTLAGYRVDSILILAGATGFNGAILALAIQYVLTGRRISKNDLTARPRAIFLSYVMLIGFPVFTIIGIICCRNLRCYFDDLSSHAKKP